MQVLIKKVWWQEKNRLSVDLVTTSFGAKPFVHYYFFSDNITTARCKEDVYEAIRKKGLHINDEELMLLAERIARIIKAMTVFSVKEG